MPVVIHIQITQNGNDLPVDQAHINRAEAGIYQPVLSVHDEVIAEGDPDLDVEDYVNELTTLPSWADGCPIAAEGWKGGRYRK